MVRRRLLLTVVQELGQAATVAAPPGNAPLGIDSLEVAHQPYSMKTFAKHMPRSTASPLRSMSRSTSAAGLRRIPVITNYQRSSELTVDAL